VAMALDVYYGHIGALAMSWYGEATRSEVYLYTTVRRYISAHKKSVGVDWKP